MPVICNSVLFASDKLLDAYVRICVDFEHRLFVAFSSSARIVLYRMPINFTIINIRTTSSLEDYVIESNTTADCKIEQIAHVRMLGSV